MIARSGCFRRRAWARSMPLGPGRGRGRGWPRGSEGLRRHDGRGRTVAGDRLVVAEGREGRTSRKRVNSSSSTRSTRVPATWAPLWVEQPPRATMPAEVGCWYPMSAPRPHGVAGSPHAEFRPQGHPAHLHGRHQRHPLPRSGPQDGEELRGPGRRHPGVDRPKARPRPRSRSTTARSSTGSSPAS